MTRVNYAKGALHNFLKTCIPISGFIHKGSRHMRGHFLWPCPELQPHNSILTDPTPEPVPHFTLYKSTHHRVPSPAHPTPPSFSQLGSNLNRRCKCLTLKTCSSLSLLLDHVKSIRAAPHRQQQAPHVTVTKREKGEGGGEDRKSLQRRQTNAVLYSSTRTRASFALACVALREEKQWVLRLSSQLKHIVGRLHSASQMQWSEINSVTQGIIAVPTLTCFLCQGRACSSSQHREPITERVGNVRIQTCV